MTKIEVENHLLIGMNWATVNRDTVLHNPEILNITVYSNDVEAG